MRALWSHFLVADNVRVRVGKAYDIQGPGHYPRVGVVSRGGGGNSLPRHPRPLRRVQLSLLYKQRGGREPGDSVADLLY